MSCANVRKWHHCAMSDPRHSGEELQGDDPRLQDFLGPAAFKLLPSIPHYYGDPARQFMIAGAVLLLLASPLYGTNLRLELPFEGIGALAAVGFAALTNPRERWASVGDVIISGLAAAAYAGWGIAEYSSY